MSISEIGKEHLDAILDEMIVEFEGEECIKIPLTRGMFALVNIEDYPKVMHTSWQAKKGVNCWHAQAAQSLMMHRVIMGCTPGDGIEIDHKNGDGLDNRKSNLRLATRAQNVVNRAKRLGGTSKYIGVSYHTRVGKFQANIKGKCLGYYIDEISAAKAFDEAAKELYGDRARLNFNGDQI